MYTFSRRERTGSGRGLDPELSDLSLVAAAAEQRTNSLAHRRSLLLRLARRAGTNERRPAAAACMQGDGDSHTAARFFGLSVACAQYDYQWGMVRVLYEVSR